MIALLLSAGLSVARFAAPAALVDTSPQSIDRVLGLSIDSRVAAFKRFPDGGARVLKSVAFDVNRALPLRWRAITTMGRLNPGGFAKEIDRALTSPEWFLRNAALIALLSDSRERALAAALKKLDDPALVVRTQAIRNLIATDAREATSALWSALYERHNFKGKESLWVRAHIAEALAKFAQPGHAAKFKRMLLDEDSRLHKWAIQGLETATGLRLGDRSEPVDVRRQQWLARLGETAI